MDNLTHTLTGVLMSRAGLNRFAPRATLMLALAANIPDLDVVSWFGGSLTYLRYHRWLTHAWALAPLLALLPALLVWFLGNRRPSLVRLWIVSLIGVTSHLLLDWTNVYGIRMLLPFSSAWLRLDAVNIVDLWVWGILLLGIAAPFLSRLVSSEIGAKATPGRGWAWFSLALVAGLVYGRVLAHERAVTTLDSRVYSGSEPLRVAAFPNSTNPFRWRGLVETGSAFLFFDLNLLTEFDPARGHSFYKPEPSPAIAAASKSETFRVFLDFSPFTLWRVTTGSGPDDASEVRALDLRFGDPSQPGFEAAAEIGLDWKVRSASFGFGHINPR